MVNFCLISIFFEKSHSPFRKKKIFEKQKGKNEDTLDRLLTQKSQVLDSFLTLQLYCEDIHVLSGRSCHFLETTKARCKAYFSPGGHLKLCFAPVQEDTETFPVCLFPGFGLWSSIFVLRAFSSVFLSSWSWTRHELFVQTLLVLDKLRRLGTLWFLHFISRSAECTKSWANKLSREGLGTIHSNSRFCSLFCVLVFL